MFGIILPTGRYFYFNPVSTHPDKQFVNHSAHYRGFVFWNTASMLLPLSCSPRCVESRALILRISSIPGCSGERQRLMPLSSLHDHPVTRLPSRLLTRNLARHIYHHGFTRSLLVSCSHVLYPSHALPPFSDDPLLSISYWISTLRLVSWVAFPYTLPFLGFILIFLSVLVGL